MNNIYKKHEIIDAKVLKIFDMVKYGQIKEIIIPSEFVYGFWFSSLRGPNEDISGKYDCKIEIGEVLYDKGHYAEYKIIFPIKIYLGNICRKTSYGNFPYPELYNAFENGWEGITIKKEKCKECVSNIDLLANLI